MPGYSKWTGSTRLAQNSAASIDTPCLGAQLQANAC